jgi:tetratricopeptide (TPR) repeat protein
MLTHAPADLPATALAGPLLDAYLDEAEALFEATEDDDGGGAENGSASDGEPAAASHARRMQALSDMLGRQPLQPGSLDVLHRVHGLWMQAGQPARALEVIDTHAAALLEELPASERHDAQVDAGFARTQSLRALPERAAQLHEALDGMARLLAQPPLEQQSDPAWEHLSGQAQRSQDYGVWRRCIQARYALQVVQPQRTSYRAWDEAVQAARLAQVAAAQGDGAQAEQLVQQAMDHLRHAAPGQDVDHEDWFRLGEQFVVLAPTSIDTIVQQIPARMPPDMPRPLQRDVWVRQARLQARALQRQGHIEAALVKAKQGRFGLTRDDDDGFSSFVLDCLLEAGRLDDAAELAYECISSQRPASAQHACAMALQQMEKHAAEGSTPHVAWHLALASAAMIEDTAWVARPQSPEAYARQHLAHARQMVPAHPALAAVEGMRLCEEGDHARALPLLETAAREPSQAAPDVLQALWVSRAKVHGIAKALQQPFPASPAAGWCYNVGVWLDFNFQDACGTSDDAWPERDIDTLKARYYEAAVVHFEAFFATGEGWFRDGDIHVYSMLCNNLAIHYRWRLQDCDKAIALHHKGLATSPFAEHHNGLVSCYEAAGRKPEFIDAADRLWHYALDYGYGRHDPTGYFKGVSHALYDLNRDNEIDIWLQRLDEWWAGLDRDEQKENEEDYLDTLLVMLRDLAWSQPADALARLERALPRALASPLPGMRRVAANVLEYAGQHERALALYQESLKRVRPDEPDDQEQAQLARSNMKRCQKAMRGKSPWWKFW